MLKNKKPILTILAAAVIFVAVGTYTMMQKDPPQIDTNTSMNKSSEKDSSESESESEELKVQDETDSLVGKTVETSSGLKYRILQIGEGSSPVEQSQVQVHYRGRLEDGTEFLSLIHI